MVKRLRSLKSSSALHLFQLLHSSLIRFSRNPLQHSDVLLELRTLDQCKILKASRDLRRSSLQPPSPSSAMGSDDVSGHYPMGTGNPLRRETAPPPKPHSPAMASLMEKNLSLISRFSVLAQLCA